MELPKDDTENRSGHRLSRAIYGGHISGRRLHGVKMNPIYQESNGSFWDNQPNTNIPGSDIQMKTYESLPGHHFMRPSSSAPNIPYVCSTSSSRVPYVCNGLLAHLGDIEQKDDTLHFSDFSLPGRADCSSKNNEGCDVQIQSDTGKRMSDRTHSWSWPHSDRGYRKQLIRQQGIDVPSDDYKHTEKSTSLTPASISPSRIPAPSIPEFTHVKRRRIPRMLKHKKFLKTKLSVLREQSTSTENEQSGMSANEHSDVSDIEQNDVSENEHCRVSDTNDEIHFIDNDYNSSSVSSDGKNGNREWQGF